MQNGGMLIAMSATTTINETITKVQEQVLDAVKLGQDRAIEAIEAYVPGLPFAEVLPQAAGVVDKSFAFAEALLVSQRAFAGRLFTALANEAKPAPVKSVKTTKATSAA